MRVGFLTGGGDAPGLNGVIEAASRTLIQQGHSIVGIQDGFEGIFGGKTIDIREESLRGIHAVAGTLLGTSNRSGTKGREEEFLRCYKALKLDGMIVCGGDGTFSGLRAFAQEIPIIGVPKTIDNDLSGTEVTFGFDTACTVVAEAIEALRATAEAHSRVMIVETMGRTAGWIALGGGLSAYADAILLPERPTSPESLKLYLKKQKSLGRRGFLISASEAASFLGEEAHVAFRVTESPQAERFGGFAEHLARWIEREIGWESRHVVLGHLQRSRFPSVTDRFLTLSMGVEVGRMVHERKWGQAVVYRSGTIERAALADLMGPVRTVSTDHRWVKLAQSLGIFI